ncbi:MAG: cytochrome-c peroxidase, partial [Rhodoferax sp.]
MKNTPWLARLHCAASIVLLSASALAASPPPPPPGIPAGAGIAPGLTQLEALGKNLFDDRALSEPAGTACVSCHPPVTGWANNHGSRSGVAAGSVPSALGLRNTLTNGYSSFIPTFSWRVRGSDVDPLGGHFWDGRADTLAAQALGPFLAAREMNNPDAASVVRKVAASPYAALMRAEFGANIFATPDLAFQKIGAAIAAFEATRGFQPFNSK